MTPSRKQLDNHDLNPPGCFSYAHRHHALRGTFALSKCAVSHFGTVRAKNNGDSWNTRGTSHYSVSIQASSGSFGAAPLTKQAATFATRFIAASAEPRKIPTLVLSPLNSAISTSPFAVRTAVEEKNIFASSITETSSENGGQVAAHSNQSSATRPLSIVRGERHEESNSSSVSVVCVGVRKSCRYKNRFRVRRRGPEVQELAPLQIQTCTKLLVPFAAFTRAVRRSGYSALPVAQFAPLNTGWLAIIRRAGATRSRLPVRFASSSQSNNNGYNSSNFDCEITPAALEPTTCQEGLRRKGLGNCLGVSPDNQQSKKGEATGKDCNACVLAARAVIYPARRGASHRAFQFERPTARQLIGSTRKLIKSERGNRGIAALNSNTPRGVRYSSQGSLRKGRKHFGADDRSLAALSARLVFSAGQDREAAAVKTARRQLRSALRCEPGTSSRGGVEGHAQNRISDPRGHVSHQAVTSPEKAGVETGPRELLKSRCRQCMHSPCRCDVEVAA
jgi:hypothetical protein